MSMTYCAKFILSNAIGNEGIEILLTPKFLFMQPCYKKQCFINYDRDIGHGLW